MQKKFNIYIFKFGYVYWLSTGTINWHHLSRGWEIWQHALKTLMTCCLGTSTALFRDLY